MNEYNFNDGVCASVFVCIGACSKCILWEYTIKVISEASVLMLNEKPLNNSSRGNR